MIKWGTLPAYMATAMEKDQQLTRSLSSLKVKSSPAVKKQQYNLLTLQLPTSICRPLQLLHILLLIIYMQKLRAPDWLKTSALFI